VVVVGESEDAGVVVDVGEEERLLVDVAGVDVDVGANGGSSAVEVEGVDDVDVGSVDELVVAGVEGDDGVDAGKVDDDTVVGVGAGEEELDVVEDVATVDEEGAEDDVVDVDVEAAVDEVAEAATVRVITP
jgi:hypothetical protein